MSQYKNQEYYFNDPNFYLGKLKNNLIQCSKNEAFD